MDADVKKYRPDELVEILSGSSRMDRKNAARRICELSKNNPEMFVDFIPEIIDAINRPEAQTRWECINTLSEISKVNDKAVSVTLDSLEDALFDEKYNLLVVAAFNFLCCFGSISEKNSSLVWPLMREAIEFYNGEIIFDSLLDCMVVFSNSKLQKNIASEIQLVLEPCMVSSFGGTQTRISHILNNID